jgi:hypothetical protein
MTTIGEFADKYEPAKKGNVTDLAEVSVNLELHEQTGKNNEGKEYKYKFIKIGESEYRVPSTVIEQVKAMRKLRPDMKTFKVTKTGSGLLTKYKVEFVS